MAYRRFATALPHCAIIGLSLVFPLAASVAAQNPNATDYIAFTTEFQRLADEMALKAKEKNLDGATLAYLRLTMNCVNCHKYVRQTTK